MFQYFRCQLDLIEALLGTRYSVTSLLESAVGLKPLVLPIILEQRALALIR